MGKVASEEELGRWLREGVGEAREHGWGGEGVMG